MKYFNPQIVFSILLHVFVIALLEVLFYFFYVTKMEEKALTDAVSGMVNNISNQTDLSMINNFLKNNRQMNNGQMNNGQMNNGQMNNGPLDINNNYTVQPSREYFEGDLNKLEKNSQNKKKEREVRQNKLLIRSLMMVGVLLLVTIGVYVLNMKKIKLGYVLKETLGVLVLMGAFEYIFFTNVILKNPTISNSELQKIIIDKQIKKLN